MKHQHVIKICKCGPRRWPKCAHAWHFWYKPRGHQRCRFSLDTELGRHIESKTEIEKIAREIRDAIDAGTFRRRSESAPSDYTAATVAPVVTLDVFIPIFIDRLASER